MKEKRFNSWHLLLSIIAGFLLSMIYNDYIKPQPALRLSKEELENVVPYAIESDQKDYILKSAAFVTRTDRVLANDSTGLIGSRRISRNIQNGNYSAIISTTY